MENPDYPNAANVQIQKLEKKLRASERDINILTEANDEYARIVAKLRERLAQIAILTMGMGPGEILTQLEEIQ